MYASSYSGQRDFERNDSSKGGRGLSVQELKAMTAMRLATSTEGRVDTVTHKGFQKPNANQQVQGAAPKRDAPLSVQDIKQLTRIRLSHQASGRTDTSYDSDSNYSGQRENKPQLVDNDSINDDADSHLNVFRKNHQSIEQRYSSSKQMDTFSSYSKLGGEGRRRPTSPLKPHNIDEDNHFRKLLLSIGGSNNSVLSNTSTASENNDLTHGIDMTSHRNSLHLSSGGNNKLSLMRGTSTSTFPLRNNINTSLQPQQQYDTYPSDILSVSSANDSTDYDIIPNKFSSLSADSNIFIPSNHFLHNSKHSQHSTTIFDNHTDTSMRTTSPLTIIKNIHNLHTANMNANGYTNTHNELHYNPDLLLPHKFQISRSPMTTLRKSNEENGSIPSVIHASNGLHSQQQQQQQHTINSTQNLLSLAQSSHLQTLRSDYDALLNSNNNNNNNYLALTQAQQHLLNLNGASNHLNNASHLQNNNNNNNNLLLNSLLLNNNANSTMASNYMSNLNGFSTTSTNTTTMNSNTATTTTPYFTLPNSTPELLLDSLSLNPISFSQGTPPILKQAKNTMLGGSTSHTDLSSLSGINGLNNTNTTNSILPTQHSIYGTSPLAESLLASNIHSSIDSLPLPPTVISNTNTTNTTTNSNNSTLGNTGIESNNSQDSARSNTSAQDFAAYNTSPKTMKILSKLPLDCPEKVRTKSITDATDIPYEMVEAVLNTPSAPNSPVRFSIGSRDGSGGVGTGIGNTSKKSSTRRSTVMLLPNTNSNNVAVAAAVATNTGSSVSSNTSSNNATAAVQS